MIVAAAIEYEGVVYTLPKPMRHHNIIKYMRDKGLPRKSVRNQGFVTNDGKFVDRLEGAAIALASGQIEELSYPPNLFSEDLW